MMKDIQKTAVDHCFVRGHKNVFRAKNSLVTHIFFLFLFKAHGYDHLMSNLKKYSLDHFFGNSRKIEIFNKICFFFGGAMLMKLELKSIKMNKTAIICVLFTF